MGCAGEGSGITASVAAAAKKYRTMRALTDTGSLLLADNDILLRQRGEPLGCHFGIENVEMRVGCQCLAQVAFCLRRISCFFVDHSRVKQRLRVFCPLRQSVRDGIGGFLKLAALIEGPRKYVPGVNVVAHFQLLPSEFQ